MLASGLSAQRKFLCAAKNVVSNNVCRYGEQPNKAHRNRLWTPLILAVFSICLNPTLLKVIGSGIHAGFIEFVLQTACGLSVISGSLAFMGFYYGMKYCPDEKIVKLGKNLSLFHGIALIVLAWPTIEGWSGDLMLWLFTLVQSPVLYLIFVLIFSILAAVILPIPVEAVLVGYIYFLMTPGSDFLGLGIAGSYILIAVVMGVGKAIGAWVVFLIGMKAEKLMNRYLSWGWFQRLIRRVERFCTRFGYLAMFLVMSIPMMTDTVPLYVFSILNKGGEVFDRNWFVLTNLWAGIARTLLVGILAIAGVMSFGYVAG